LYVSSVAIRDIRSLNEVDGIKHRGFMVRIAAGSEIGK
jgi:hypothetical protein